jgi:hypothetical protein
MATKFHVAEVPGTNGAVMYRGSVSDAQGTILDHTRRYYNRKNARAAAVALKHKHDNREPEIKVVHDDVAAFWDRNSAWQATFGDYDLDCLVGSGHTPLDAIVDLLDKAEG